MYSCLGLIFIKKVRTELENVEFNVHTVSNTFIQKVVQVVYKAFQVPKSPTYKFT